jgi:hypothetical protein
MTQLRDDAYAIEDTLKEARTDVLVLLTRTQEETNIAETTPSISAIESAFHYLNDAIDNIEEISAVLQERQL